MYAGRVPSRASRISPCNPPAGTIEIDGTAQVAVAKMAQADRRLDEPLVEAFSSLEVSIQRDSQTHGLRKNPTVEKTMPARYLDHRQRRLSYAYLGGGRAFSRKVSVIDCQVNKLRAVATRSNVSCISMLQACAPPRHVDNVSPPGSRQTTKTWGPSMNLSQAMSLSTVILLCGRCGTTWQRGLTLVQVFSPAGRARRLRRATAGRARPGKPGEGEWFEQYAGSGEKVLPPLMISLVRWRRKPDTWRKSSRAGKVLLLQDRLRSNSQSEQVSR